jgi:hypothetical protein
MQAIPTKPPTLDGIPELMEIMLKEKGEKSAAATKQMYERRTSRGHTCATFGCLMNLTFLEASITTILQQDSTVADGKDAKTPLDNPGSLLRVLEKLLTHSPAVPKSKSGKLEGVH